MDDGTIRREIVGRPARLAFALALGAALGCGGPSHDEWNPPHSARASRTRRAAGMSGGVLAAARPNSEALQLFAKNCATCHGLDGSGQGPSVLDRPARNFKDGGFSFGNTADAIFNTLSHGIPGTPMPAFGESLDEGQRHLLAAYVRTLGPAVEEVDVADTILTVTEESGPLIVRGILPPIVDGAPIRPRGMLVGLPGGLTFEYRIDDVRLLGVRQGGFVERTDWNNRGGTPLKPLGGLIWTDSGGTPPCMFSLEPETTLRRQLERTFGKRLDSRLLEADGRTVAEIEEELFASKQGRLTGFAQILEITGNRSSISETSLSVRIPTPAHAELVKVIPGNEEEVTWHVFRRDDGVFECLGTLFEASPPLPEPALSATHDFVGFSLAMQRYENSPTLSPRARVVIHRLFSSSWPDVARSLLQESGR
jgi:hypothetical protein